MPEALVGTCAVSTSIRRASIVIAFGLGLGVAIGTGGVSTFARQAVPQMTLAIPGSINSAPSLAVLGRLVVAVWLAAKEGTANVYVATSNDGGTTFSAPRRVNDSDGDVSVNSEQPPRAAVSGTGSSRIITVVWSKRNDGPQKARRDVIRIARSIDDGRSFSPSRTIHDAAVSGARGWESLTTGTDGVVHGLWLDGRDAERKMAEVAAHGGTHKGQPPQDLYHGILSPDRSRTESVVATGVCFCCKTAVAIDAGGAVYAAWRHIFPGSLRDIAFAKSTDGGRHFGPPVKVSDDRWELNGCPEDGPTMAVDQSGVIHIAWATVVGNGEPQKTVFYTTSRDGKTFSPRTRVPAADVTNSGHPQLTLLADGGAAIAWDDIVDGVRRVLFSRVSRNGVVAAPQTLSSNESASHPVIARSMMNLLVAWTSRSSASPSSPADRSVIKLSRISLAR